MSQKNISEQEYLALLERIQTLESSCVHNKDFYELSGKVDTLNSLASPMFQNADTAISASLDAVDLVTNQADKILEQSQAYINITDFWLTWIGIIAAIIAILFPIISSVYTHHVLKGQRQKALIDITKSISEGVLPNDSNVSVREAILRTFVRDSIFKNAISDIVQHSFENQSTERDITPTGNLDFSQEVEDDNT